MDKEVEVVADIYKMMSAKVSFYDVLSSVQNENVSITAGNLKSGGKRKSITILGEIESPKDLENFVVKSENDSPIFLKDIAQIKFKEKEATTYARENGNSVVMLEIKKRSGQNLISAAKKIRQIISESKETYFPKNLEISITNDLSELTENQVTDLVNSIVFGVVLVVIVLLFPRFKNALFVGFAIPMSMFMSLVILEGMGNTLNTMILFGLIMDWERLLIME